MPAPAKNSAATHGKRKKNQLTLAMRNQLVKHTSELPNKICSKTPKEIDKRNTNMTSSNAQAITILFADDSGGDQILVQHALRELPWEINLVCVSSGIGVMDYLCRRGEFSHLEETTQPALVLLDLRMPEKNGVETLMEMRAHPGFATVPICVLTGVQPTGPLIDFLGDTPYAPKPRDFSELVDFLREIIAPIVEKRRQPQVSSAAKTEHSDTNKFHILFADDNIADQNLVQLALQELHLQVELRCVEDGREALEYLHRQGRHANTPTAQLPNLIIMDLWMPAKTGFETIREIKSNPEFSQIPIIVFSSSDLQIRNHFTAEEAVAFYRKPEDFNELLNILDAILVGHFHLVRTGPTSI